MQSCWKSIIATPVSPALPAKADPPINRVPDPDDLPVLDRATIERTALHRGPARGPADARSPSSCSPI